MDTIMKEHLKGLILSGNFEIAKKIIENYSIKVREDVLTSLAYETKSLAFYTFVVDRLLDKETADWHCLASQLFMVSLCIFEGADPVGLYHIKRATELDPSDIGFKKLFLSYYHDVPEALLTKEEATKIAKEILAMDPDNSYALKALKRVESS